MTVKTFKFKKLSLTSLTAQTTQNWKSIFKIWLFNHLSMNLGAHYQLVKSIFEASSNFNNKKPQVKRAKEKSMNKHDSVFSYIKQAHPTIFSKVPIFALMCFLQKSCQVESGDIAVKVLEAHYSIQLVYTAHFRLCTLLIGCFCSSGWQFSGQLFEKYCRVRTIKLHRIKVNKRQKKIGRYFLWGKTQFF